MKAKWFIGLLLTVATLAGAQTNNLTTLLQQGMFEEQANRNLDAAIATYESLATQFDQDRQLAATAVFRLGECYRALGRSPEAAAQYQRVIRDFSDQTILITLSRQNLAGMGLAPATGRAGTGAASGEVPVSAEATALATQISGIEKLAADPEEQARAVLAIFPDDELKKMLLYLPTIKEQKAKLEANPKLTFADLAGPGAAGLHFAIGSRDNLPPLNLISEESRQDQTNMLAGAQREFKQQMANLHDRVEFVLNLQKARLKALAAGAGTAGASETAAANPAAQLWAKLKDLPADKLEQILPTVVADTTLNALLQQRNEARSHLTLITNDYARSSVEYTRAKSVLDEVDRQVADKVAGVMEGLRLRAELPADALGGTSGTAAIQTESDEDREIERVTQLIRSSPDLINAEGNDGTPLVKAAYNGWQKVAAYLLDHGADVNQPAAVYWIKDLEYAGASSPLMAAVAAGNKAMVQFLLSRGAEVNSRSKANRMPLNIAVQKGYLAVTELLLTNHADVNAKAFENLTPLMAAVDGSQTKLVQMMLRAGAEVNATDIRGETALIRALSQNTEIVQTLLKAGADPNTKDENGRTPLSFAVNNHKPEIVKLLLAAKADPNGAKLDTPLLVAIHDKDAISAELLLAAGANVNDLGIIESRGERIFGPPGRHFSIIPLSLAVEENDVSLVQLLLKYKADPNAPYQDNKKPAIFSVLDHPDLLDALLQGGADVNGNIQPSATGEYAANTPLLEAVERDLIPAVELLLQHGADPNSTDKDGDSSLINAAFRSTNEKLFAALLDHGANPNQVNTRGQTPLSFLKTMAQDANRRAQVENIMTLLRQHGALDKLPAWNCITVSRPSTGFSTPVFLDNQNHWNRFTLLELLMNNNFDHNRLPFADLARVTIVRPSRNSTNETRIAVNLLDTTNGIDLSKDVRLLFGDEVEIPEHEHALSENADMLTSQQNDELRSFTLKKVHLIAHGKTAELSIERNSDNALVGVVLGWNEARQILSSASDLAHVKVTRRDPQTAESHEWTLDCNPVPNASNDSIPRPRRTSRSFPGILPRGPGRGPINNVEVSTPDFWLESGDVIEVPDLP
jgi:ankyrin repeat protein